MTSPRLNARIAGLLYLIVVIASVFALTSVSPLIVRDDAAKTAANILDAELRYRLAFTANLIAAIAYAGVVAILYELFRPAGRTLSTVAAFIGLGGCVISGVVMANQLAPFIYLGDASYLAAFTPDQLQASARISLREQGIGNSISLVFFGFYCLLIGVLVFRSRFLPRVLGALMCAAGLGWLVGNVSGFIDPSLGLASMLLPVSGVCELLFTLWLLAAGVDAAKWREQASAAAGQET